MRIAKLSLENENQKIKNVQSTTATPANIAGFLLIEVRNLFELMFYALKPEAS